MDNYRKIFSEDLKRGIVRELDSGVLSLRDAARMCGTSSGQIKSWLNNYGRYQPKRDILEVVMKSEQEKIRELEKALAEAHLQIRLYGHIIDLASKEYKTDLKKTMGKGNSERMSQARQCRSACCMQGAWV